MDKIESFFCKYPDIFFGLNLFSSRDPGLEFLCFLCAFAKGNLLAFGGKTCGLKLKHCLKDLRIKLVHFYKRCVSITVVKPRHFLRAKDSSRKSPFLFKDRRGLANKEANELYQQLNVLVCYKTDR